MVLKQSDLGLGFWILAIVSAAWLYVFRSLILLVIWYITVYDLWSGVGIWRRDPASEFGLSVWPWSLVSGSGLGVWSQGLALEWLLDVALSHPVLGF